MADASRDQNYVTTLLGVSNVDGTTPVKVYADPTTHRLLVDLASGSGTVTDVSVVSANGFAGSVATSTTTPAITLSTTITGILKGNGTAMSAASAGTDYTDNAFKTISVAGQTDVVADSAADTLTLVAGTNVTITTDATTDTITINSSGGASGITIGTTTITSGTDTRILYDNAGVVGEYTLTGSGTVVAMATAPTFQTSINGAYLTASEMLITDASKNIVSAAVATYPSLTELSYVKGVTSALQTQLNALMTNPMTTGGDVIYGGASGTPTRLANGTAGYLLQSNGTTLAPTWVTAPASGLTIGTTAITSGTTTRILYDNAGTLGEYTITGTGTVVAMQTSPAFTTPSLGVATATSINGNTFTTGTYTLTGTAAKTLNFTNTLTLSGTDSTTMTFPSTSATIARTDAGQTFTGTQVLAEKCFYTV
jgi:hypothetical protein